MEAPEGSYHILKEGFLKGYYCHFRGSIEGLGRCTTYSGWRASEIGVKRGQNPSKPHWFLEVLQKGYKQHFLVHSQMLLFSLR